MKSLRRIIASILVFLTPGFSALAVTNETQNPSLPPPTNLRAVDVGSTSLRLNWDQPQQTAGTNYTAPSGYKIYKNDNVLTQVQSPTILQFVDQQVQPSTAYTYKVVSVDPNNGVSIPSNVITVTTTAISTAPNYFVITGNVKDAAGQLKPQIYIKVQNLQTNEIRSTVTDSTGTYRLEVIPGEYKVSAIVPDSGSFTAPAPITTGGAAGTTQTVNIVLTATIANPTPSPTPTPTPAPTPTPPPATPPASNKYLSGTVKYQNGEIITEGTVTAYNTVTGVAKSGILSANGSFALALTTGSWQVKVAPKTEGLWSVPDAQIIQFADTTTSEVKTLAFVVNRALGKLVISVTADNALKSGVGIQAISGTCESTVSTTVAPIYRVTDTTGSASFDLNAGAYCIRAAIASSTGFLGPQPKLVQITDGHTTTESFVLIKQATADTITVVGSVIAEDETKVPNANIYFFSQEGVNIKTITDANGAFVVKLPKNQQFEVKATVESASILKNSAAIKFASTADKDLAIQVLPVRPLPPPVTVAKPITETIEAKSTDGAQVAVPPNSATATSLSVTVDASADVPEVNGSRVLSGVAYNITAKDQGGNSVTTFNQNVQVTLPFTLEPGRNISDLAPAYYDETTGTWVRLQNFTVDTTRGVIIAYVAHFTLFAIVVAADTTAPATPTSLNAKVENNKVVLSWTNPQADFHHSKIYRSEASGSEGTLLDDLAPGSSYTDAAAISGKTYYYSIQSVDASGNTSTKTSQVMIKVVAGASTGTTAGTHPFGTNIKGSDGTIYYLSFDNTRRPYTSAGAFLSFGFNSWTGVVDASAQDLTLPVGSFVPPMDGRIVCSDRGADKGTCYLMTRGKKAGFVSEAVFKAQGHTFTRSLFGDVSWMESAGNIETGTVAHHPGTVVNNGGTLQVIGTRGGLIGFATFQDFTDWGFDAKDVVSANDEDKKKVQDGVASIKITGKLTLFE